MGKEDAYVVVTVADTHNPDSSPTAALMAAGYYTLALAEPDTRSTHSAAAGLAEQYTRTVDPAHRDLLSLAATYNILP